MADFPNSTTAPKDIETTMGRPQINALAHDRLLAIAEQLDEAYRLLTAGRLAAMAAIEGAGSSDNRAAVDHVLIAGINTLDEARDAIEELRS